MRSSLETLDAKVWMDERFYMYESQPNSKEIHIDSTYKLSIFEEYVKDMKAEKRRRTWPTSRVQVPGALDHLLLPGEDTRC